MVHRRTQDRDDVTVVTVAPTDVGAWSAIQNDLLHPGFFAKLRESLHRQNATHLRGCLDVKEVGETVGRGKGEHDVDAQRHVKSDGEKVNSRGGHEHLGHAAADAPIDFDDDRTRWCEFYFGVQASLDDSQGVGGARGYGEYALREGLVEVCGDEEARLAKREGRRHPPVDREVAHHAVAHDALHRDVARKVTSAQWFFAVGDVLLEDK